MTDNARVESTSKTLNNTLFVTQCETQPGLSLSNSKLNIAHLNVCGLPDKSIFPDFREFLEPFQLIFLTETHTDQFDTIVIPGFQVLTKHRSKMIKKSGGIALAVNNNFGIDRIEHIENYNDYSYWFKLRKEHTQSDKDLLVAVCYFPCEGSPYRNNECFEILQNDILKLYNPDDSYFFLTGDFNSRIKDLNEILQIDQDLLNICNITDTINTNEASIIVENLGLSLYRQ